MGQVETEKLMELLLSAALSRALCTVAALGVADQIEPGVPQSADYIAGKTGAHPRSLYRILRFLAGHGVFREQTDRQFDHTPLSVCLRTDAEGSFRPAAVMFHRIFPAWEGLDQAAKSGEPGLSFISERPLFDHVRTDPELASLFDAGMTAIHGHETRAMLEAYDFGDVRILADIGGGNGSLIGAVLADYLEMQGILFDLGHVGERSRNHLDRFGVLDRCTVLEGDFLMGVPAGADTYLLRHIIHNWIDERAIRILSNCREVIPTDGKLLLVEAVIPGGNQPSLVKASDMAMLVFAGGMERNEEEYRLLLEHARFELVGITPTGSAVSVIESVPA